MNRGKYIVLEGPEGVGKTTQLHELARRLQAAGLPVRVLREPDSQSDLTARAIRRLTQDPHYPMNTRTEVLLYNAARAQSLQAIKNSIENGIICLVDRNYLTTLAIQYYGRGDVPDYKTINGIINFAVGGIEPDLCIVMDAPVTTLRERLQYRNNGERFDNLDDAFLERVRSGYLWEARQRDFPVVFATEDPDKVADRIWQLVSANLAVRDHTAVPSEPVPVKEIIEHRTLPVRPAEQNSEAQIKGPTLQTASELCLQRIASNRAATIQVTSLDKAQYYTPSGLKPAIHKQYQEAMDMIFELHETMLGKASNEETRSAITAVLPLAAQSAVMIDDLDEATVVKLLSDELPEARQAGQDLLEQTQESLSSLEQLQAKVAYRITVRQTAVQLAKDNLPDNHALAAGQAVTLIDYWPKNELLLVPEMLYENSNLPLEQLQPAINDWSYDQKAQAFKGYVGEGQQPGRALEKAHYSWDVLSDYTAFKELQLQRYVDSPAWQPLTPRYGYEVPKAIEDAGLTDQFEACFDISLKLYSLLQKEGHAAEAQYAVLRGHKLRWKVTFNARQAFRLDASEYLAGSGIVRQMQEKLAEVHPLLGDSVSSFTPTRG